MPKWIRNLIQIGAERLPCEFPKLLGPWSAFASENGASVFVAQNAVLCPVCFHLGYLIPCRYLVYTQRSEPPRPRLGKLLGPWSAFVSRGWSWTSRTSLRFLPTLLAHIECQKSRSSPPECPVTGYLAHKASPVTSNRYWAHKASRLIHSLQPPNQRSLPHSHQVRWHYLLQTSLDTRGNALRCPRFRIAWEHGSSTPRGSEGTS